MLAIPRFLQHVQANGSVSLQRSVPSPESPRKRLVGASSWSWRLWRPAWTSSPRGTSCPGSAPTWACPSRFKWRPPLLRGRPWSWTWFRVEAPSPWRQQPSTWRLRRLQRRRLRKVRPHDRNDPNVNVTNVRDRWEGPSAPKRNMRLGTVWVHPLLLEQMFWIVYRPGSCVLQKLETLLEWRTSPSGSPTGSSTPALLNFSLPTSSLTPPSTSFPSCEEDQPPTSSSVSGSAFEFVKVGGFFSQEGSLDRIKWTHIPDCCLVFQLCVQTVPCVNVPEGGGHARSFRLVSDSTPKTVFVEKKQLLFCLN